MLPETDFNIRTMTKIKPLVLLTFEDVCIKHKKIALITQSLLAGYRGQLSNLIFADLALIKGFIDKYRLFEEEG